MNNDALASGSPQNNPRVPTAEEIIALYKDAWSHQRDLEQQMIPDIPQFHDSLSAVRVLSTPSMDTSEHCIIICNQLRRIHTNHTRAEDDSVVALTQEHDAPLSLARLIDRIGDELDKLGHPYTSPKTDCRMSLASKILGLSVVTQPRMTSPIEAVNFWLSRISVARVAQWVVFTDSPFSGSDQDQFGDFTYGPIDIAMLNSRCRRAGSSFFDQHGSRLQGNARSAEMAGKFRFNHHFGG